MVEWIDFKQEPSVDNYLELKKIERKLTFRQKLLEQLGIKEYCPAGHEKTIVCGTYREKLRCECE